MQNNLNTSKVRTRSASFEWDYMKNKTKYGLPGQRLAKPSSHEPRLDGGAAQDLRAPELQKFPSKNVFDWTQHLTNPPNLLSTSSFCAAASRRTFRETLVQDKEKGRALVAILDGDGEESAMDGDGEECGMAGNNPWLRTEPCTTTSTAEKNVAST